LLDVLAQPLALRLVATGDAEIGVAEVHRPPRELLPLAGDPLRAVAPDVQAPVEEAPNQLLVEHQRLLCRVPRWRRRVPLRVEQEAPVVLLSCVLAIAAGRDLEATAANALGDVVD